MSSEVTAATPILNTQTNTLGSTLGMHQLADLPLSIVGGRDAANFAFATIPGVEGNTYFSYISGTQSFSKAVTIDGAFAQASETGHMGESFPSMEAVQEFRVDTGGGGGSAGLYTAGGTFMYTLKSGTNRFHGSAFGFLRNEALNANSWSNNYFGRKRDRNRETDYGFSGGGPVYIPHIYNGKDKTFFFAAFEQYRLTDYRMGPVNDTVPTLAFLDGDLSALLNKSVVLGTDAAGNPIYQGAIFDPGTGKVFVNNIIPQARISKVAKNIMQYYRDYYPPLNNGIINNNAEPAIGSPYFIQNQYSIKVDHNLSDNDRLNGSFIHTIRHNFQVGNGTVGNASNGPWSWNGKDIKFGGPLSMARWHDIPYWRGQLSWSHSSPNFLNVATYSYNRFWVGSESVHRGKGLQQAIGFADVPNNGAMSGISFGSAVNGYFEDSIGYPGNGPYWWQANVIDEKADWIKGRHTISFGGEYRAFQIQNTNQAGGLSFAFSNLTTGTPTQPYSARVGFGFASFLLGQVHGASMQRPISLYGRRKSGAVFIEDRWKVNNRVTLNYGLNWNYYGPLREKYGHWANFNKTAINPTLGIPGVMEYLSNGDQTFEGDPNMKLFNPHVGAAIRITDKLVARMAYSMFYVPIGTDYWGGVPYSAYSTPGYFPTNQVTPRADLLPAFNWDNGYPGKFVQGALDPNYLSTIMINVNPHMLDAGRMNQWNAGVEYGITDNTRVSFNYVGSRGTRLHDGSLETYQPDASTYAKLLQSGRYSAVVTSAASAAAAGVPYPYPGFTGYAYMAISPFPQLARLGTSLAHVGSPYGISQYDSFQVEVVQRLSHGIAANLSYSLDHYRSNSADINFAETGYLLGKIQNYSDLSYDANYIQPYNRSIFKGYVQWSLPLGKGRQFLSGSGKLVESLLSNWSLGTTIYLSTGTPLSIYSTNYYPGWNGRVFSNVAPGADLSRHFDGSQLDLTNLANPVNRYFNPSGFSNPAFGSFGNSGPYIPGLKGFGTYNQNLSVIKSFKIKLIESARLQLRAEFFNIFNRHSFGAPNTNISSPYFGQVTSVSSDCRRGQIGVRFEW